MAHCAPQGRTELHTFVYLNRTCDAPGYYSQYKFVFEEWAPERNDARYGDGYVFRDINLNPNGASWHYGVPMAKAAAAETTVPTAFANLAVWKPAYQSSILRNQNG